MLVRKSKFKSIRSWSPEEYVDNWPQIRIFMLRNRIRIRITLKIRKDIRIQVKTWIRIRKPVEKKARNGSEGKVRSSIVEPEPGADIKLPPRDEIL
jgi:hypothetical protein